MILRTASLLCLACLIATADVFSSRERAISLHAPADSGKAWLEFVLRADQDVRDFLELGEKSEPRHTLRIRIGEKAESKPPFVLAFTGQEFRTDVEARVYEALLVRAVMPTDGKPREVPSAKWLAAALTLRDLVGDPKRLARTDVDYEPLRAGFRQGVFPDVARIMASPVPPTNPLLFRFYATHCSILLDAIRNETGLPDRPLLQLLDLEYHGRSTVDALTFLLQPALGQGETIQAWYERVVPDLSRRGRRMSQAEDIVQRLQDLTTVPALGAGEGFGTIKRVPIEELTKHLDEYRLDQAAVARIYGQIFEVQKDAPILLRDAVGGYMQAFESLRNGKVRRFRSQIRRAREDLSAAVEKQRAVEKLLDDIQEGYTTDAERFAPYLDAVERTDKDIRQLDPKIHELLDKAEE
jgi:hypothetical protein